MNEEFLLTDVDKSAVVREYTDTPEIYRRKFRIKTPNYALDQTKQDFSPTIKIRKITV